MLAEPTALLLQRGGIRPGMRVLDLGTGLGDVAFEVAAMVGADGSVVGVEQDPALLAAAEQRRTATGVPNVVFRQGDARTSWTTSFSTRWSAGCCSSTCPTPRTSSPTMSSISAPEA